MANRELAFSVTFIIICSETNLKIMPTNQNHLCLTVVALVLLPCLLTVCSAAAMTTNNITIDELALFALKSRITEPSFQQTLGKNWTIGSSVCSWIGVTCGSRHRRVTALNISNMNLTGTIPSHLGNLSFLVSLDMSMNYFEGEFPDEFSRFRRLKWLDLSINNLNGQFPPWIGSSSFHELEYLSLKTNYFTGVIPPSISNMSKLTAFIASFNYLQGNLPPEIFNISTLEIITLGENHQYFSAGWLPDDLCQQLPNLWWLDLERTKLKGQIPSSIGQCTQLQTLLFGYNSLNGVIPRQLGNLTALQALALQNNLLEGSIPKEIGNSSMLLSLDFSFNKLKGVIPEEINKLPNIEEILFGFNKLTGSIPVGIFNLSTIALMALSNNQLSGNLPPTMCYTLPYLQNLYLASNRFSGPIPNSISNCTNLQVLELSANNFTGSIPNSLGDLSFLQDLNLWQNNLISDPSSPVLNFITSLANCQYLVALHVDDNPLNGVLPESVGNLSSSLETFDAKNCKIRGRIPSGIGNLSHLDALSLYGNPLVGSLPDSMKNMQSLQILYLSGNKIHISLQLFCDLPNLGNLQLDENIIIGGAIPNCFENITSLRYLNLSSSELNSELPVSFWNLKNLLELDISSNSLSGSLPSDISNFKQATYMDFSRNHFSGDIPSVIGDLVNLEAFSLRNNKFQGQIPETMGNMLSLQQLILSHNFFSGSLPMSLEKLQNLASFDVSFNNLSGEIPSQGPFANFTAEPFFSNRALCGAQRFHVPPCPKSSAQRKTASRGNVLKTLIILVAVISAIGKSPSEELFGENMSLRSWVQESVLNNGMANVIDADLMLTINQHLPEILAEISSIMDVALACTNVSPRERSNIKEVLASLNKIRLQLLPYTDGSQGMEDISSN
ncbi:OLC1v1023721C1 [Oldenlandia corymbosa var. corymbosa]|uniref:OLC1v1023721C1 n=1 Tax=Oldenlandia corymbosa var. corymbosa TaxID=529605 RepID=A0AAV1C0U4_OLDCO|nr:OLC1v1023721C1 [Oldenlandia corymbosa var. corymbosa]